MSKANRGGGGNDRDRDRNQSSRVNYMEEQERVKNFLNNFTDSTMSGPQLKYMKQLHEILR